ncbi:hypothetical protein COU61_03840 [Candidatus Pacearchaeota archaeon CG10_big_fil_rev_8_21_14_0_10_35_13]|nr:MAG: hypothetical protein COU61_03840 [Candidatus Pacearchaeota archaeon CG10_big_fil_rev_8_21_14_0_10_35_13]
MNKKTEIPEYQKYRWFFTTNGKLVIGGKNAKQNELLVKEMIKTKKGYIVMHTEKPGSPFTFLYDENEGVSEEDLEEQAIFTASFSQEWKNLRRKENKEKKSEIGIFNSEQIIKKRGMKEGTFGIIGKVITRKVKTELWIEEQEGVIRAVPKKSKDNKIDIKITPGTMSKEEATKEIITLLKEKGINKDKAEVMQGIPAGGMNIETNV